MKRLGKDKCLSDNPLGRAAAAFLRMLEPLMFPSKCMKCGVYLQRGFDPGPLDLASCFCSHCLKDGIHFLTPPFCTLCGVRFQKGSGGANHVCGVCLKTPLKLSRVRAVAEYRGIVQDGIQLLKYHSKTSVAQVFETMMFQAFLEHYEDQPVDLIMPLPLHASRMRKRGFNQAYLLFRNFKRLYRRAFGRAPAFDLDTTSLVRIRKTLPQTGFDIEQRKNNVKDAFQVARPDRIEGKHILLVDDVLTTGATCNEAAKSLLKHGAARVDALVLARA